MRRALCLAILLTLVTRLIAAQSDVSLGLGAGTVRYTGGTAFSSAALSSAGEIDRPTLSASGGASFASLPEAMWSLQGRGDVWGTGPRLGRALRLGGELISAGARRSDGSWSAAAHGVGELIWSRRRWGLGLGAGPSAGWTLDKIPRDTTDTTPSPAPSVSSVAALHLRARGWWHVGPAYSSFSLEPTRFPDGWFTDVGTGITMMRGPATASLWVQTRLSAAFGSTAAASVAVQAFVSPVISLELSGGSFLREPYQGLPRAGYVTFAAQLHAHRRLVHALSPPLSPLTPVTRGDSLVVRFHMSGARSVAIAGDWNAWSPAPLRPLTGDVWEGVLALRPGVYHFNLLVDGSEWVVPSGVATVADGLGGMVGVLAVQ